MSGDRASLIDKISYIREKKDRIGDLPAKVDDYAGVLVSHVRASGYGSAVVNPLGALSVEDAVDEIWRERDKANSAIRETWAKLDQLDPDLEVPVRFIDVANEWRGLRNTLIEVGNNFNDTNLASEWQGAAATRYAELRVRQKDAFDFLPLEFDKIAQSLETIASSELTLYGELAVKAQELITKVEEVTVDYIDALLDVFSLSGAVAQIKALTSAVEAANSFILGVVRGMAEAAKNNMIEGNKIAESIDVQKGLPDNRWPSAVKSSYGAGIEGIRAAIGDGSTRDGDKSDWSVAR
ncbi:hypothetical protein [Nocardia jiangsuensis]|uniref:Type VII secretion system (Wss) protein ESAT-6 n=1 Tax=Nocardia jiangsuensis TaxID=1691563 RepID=A0ABV8DWZ2_9NOCA